jgi:hypothetical protein
MTPFVTALVTRAWVEYSLWTRPNGRRHRETDPEVTPHLLRYYAAVKLGRLARDASEIHAADMRHSLPSAEQLQSSRWHDKNYWSAAFISYLFFFAGAGAQFLYSLRHAKYVSDARNNLHQNTALRPFQAYPLNALPPGEGDVIVRRRAGTVEWADLPADFDGHCDLVVDASSRTQVVAIGGNVRIRNAGDDGLTVNRRTYQRDAAGFVTAGDGIALIKNFK